jgi:hypothetical protein
MPVVGTTVVVPVKLMSVMAPNGVPGTVGMNADTVDRAGCPT